jgi:hypothetical protein
VYGSPQDSSTSAGSSDCGAPVAIPDALAATPPGAELGGLLAGIDVERVSGFDTVEVLKAAYRQLCHERARFLAVVLEVGLREPFSGDSVARLEVPDEFGPDETRAALVWSRRRSDTTFERAWDVHRRLPALGEAMLAGWLDEPRAAAFIRWTAGLTGEQAQRVCDLLLPQAPGWTVGELVEQIQRLAMAIDPEWAERRYREAVRRRRVVGVRNDDGTASVSGLDLPVDRAAAGCERIDVLARACKRAGDRRHINHIRADLFLGSLDGSFEGMTDEEVVAHVLAHPFVDPPEPGVGSGRGSGDDAGPDPGPGEPDGSPGGGPGCGPEPGPVPVPVAGLPEGAASGRDPRPSDADCMASGGWAAGEVRVELTTLVGLDEHPGQVPGWGQVHADLARRMVGGMLAGEWRFAVCADDGHLLFAGTTRQRPCASSARPVRDARRGGIVELQITKARLDDLACHLEDLGLWAGLVADLAQQVTVQMAGAGPGVGQEAGSGVRSGEDRRQANATLRRYVQIRGRVCSRPGCRVPATKTDQDHVIDWAAGGSSSDGNLHLVCRHDHRAKHRGGWRVTKPSARLVVWTSPLGHVYPARSAPVMTRVPWPDPQPRHWPDTPPEKLTGEGTPVMST